MKINENNVISFIFYEEENKCQIINGGGVIQGQENKLIEKAKVFDYFLHFSDLTLIRYANQIYFLGSIQNKKYKTFEIHKLIQNLGISMSMFAKNLGVSPQLLYYYLKLDDINKWPKDIKERLFQLLNIDENFMEEDRTEISYPFGYIEYRDKNGQAKGKHLITTFLYDLLNCFKKIGINIRIVPGFHQQEEGIKITILEPQIILNNIFGKNNHLSQEEQEFFEHTFRGFRTQEEFANSEFRRKLSFNPKN